MLFLLLLTLARPAEGAEPYRPQFHFSPPRNWMNDPNGTVFFRGDYHLFYQYNPQGNTWGHMSWGHATSRDLVHWKHLPLALAEENGIMMFSGSAVVDERNTSGLCRQGRPCLVAIYTGHGNGRQTQNLAYSNDRGRTWTKYSGNPVLDLGLKDFRDPKVSWNQGLGQWVMVVALPTEKKVRFYGSSDLKTWKALSDFGPAGATGGLWECPDLFPLPVAGEAKPKWVLIVSVNPGGPAGGSAVQYFTGDFDGQRFVNDNEGSTTLWADYGADFYAATSYAGLADRRVWLGWFSNWRYARNEPTEPWRTIQSVPRELGLKRTSAGLRLTQRPVRELARIRRGDAVSPLGFHSQTFEAEFDLVPGAAIEVLKGAKEQTVVGVDAAGNVFVDRTQSGNTSFHPAFSARHVAPSTPAGRVRVLVDRSSVEVFAGDGEVVISDRVFPSEGSDGIGISGDVRNLKLYRLRP